MKIDIKINKKLKHLIDPVDTFNVVKGGKGSGKSHGIADILILKLLRESNILILVAKGTLKSTDLSVKKLFTDKLREYGIIEQFDVLSSKQQIRNKNNGSVINFIGLSNPDSHKSLEGAKYLWIEEANIDIPLNTFDVMIPILRQENYRMYFTFNPRHKTDAIWKFMEAEEYGKVNITHINYLDNPLLPQNKEYEIERVKERNLLKYNHQYLGELETISEDADWKEWMIQKTDSSFLDMKDYLEDTFISVDPNGGNKDKGDAFGIVVGSKSQDEKFYIWKDATDHYTYVEAARQIILLYEQYNCSGVVIEKNGVGSGFKTILEQELKLCKRLPIPVYEVHAKIGKKTRAKPISALYENLLVYHYGNLEELRLEMLTFTGEKGQPSPNRLDALVWLLSKFIGKNNVTASKGRKLTDMSVLNKRLNRR